MATRLGTLSRRVGVVLDFVGPLLGKFEQRRRVATSSPQILSNTFIGREFLSVWVMEVTSAHPFSSKQFQFQRVGLYEKKVYIKLFQVIRTEKEYSC